MMTISTSDKVFRRAAANSTYKKLAVQWLQEFQFSNGTLVLADSLRLRNRQLLKPTKRYASCFGTMLTLNIRTSIEQFFRPY